MKPRQRRAQAACVLLSLTAAGVSGFVAPRQGPVLTHQYRHLSLTLSLNRASPVQPRHQLQARRHGAFHSSSSSNSRSSSRGIVHAGPLSMGASGEGDGNKQDETGESAQVCRRQGISRYLYFSALRSVCMCHIVIMCRVLRSSVQHAIITAAVSSYPMSITITSCRMSRPVCQIMASQE